MFCFAEWLRQQPNGDGDLDACASAVSGIPVASQITARDLEQSVALKQLGFALNERRARELKRRYGMSPQAYYLLWLQQGGACAICRVPPKGTLFVDHCHLSGQVRGLICRTCNLAIGHFRDDPLIARAATAYLEAARQRIGRIPEIAAALSAIDDERDRALGGSHRD